ncbi:MAG: polymer-forming cytoskeletal protein [Chiayiivirga sp.]|nr:polymer-forming cytoskeletal protein [Chiayiivirga sp.]
MFGDKKKAARAVGSVETLIGSQVRIRGDLEFSGGLYVDGSIHGAVTAAADGPGAVLTLAEAGRIEGEVRAPVIILNGTLVGDVHASQRVELGPTARVEGNIYYAVVEMVAGATVTGRLIHDDGKPRQLTGPGAENATAT